MSSEKEIFKIHIDTLRQTILARMSIILTCTSLIAAILIVATFNESFLGKSEILKRIIVFLLNLIPITLFDYSFKLNNGEVNVIKTIDPEGHKKAQNQPFFKKLAIRSDIYLYIPFISIAIIIIIGLTTRSICFTILIGFIDILIIFLIKKYSEE